MATFTVVGTSTIATAATTDPQSWAVPVPSGAVVGDLLALGFVGAGYSTVTDSRLTAVEYLGIEVGGFGRATDLSDVTFETTSDGPGLAILVAVRTSGLGAPTADGFTGGDYAYGMFGDQAGFVAGLAFVTDIVNGDPETAVGWTDEGLVSVTDGAYYSLRAYSYAGGDPVPALYVEDSLGGGGTRNAMWLWWPVRSSRPVLRQRQSPLWAPSRNSDSYHLRNNQTPYL